jgi:hypothetical protein
MRRHPPLIEEEEKEPAEIRLDVQGETGASQQFRD